MAFRALVIEDSWIFQKVMVQVLESIDDIASVEVSGTGLDGLKRIGVGGIDVLFLDMNLPDMSGMDILARLQNQALAPKVIVVSSTGGLGTDVTINALQRGALSYVCKPSGSGLTESTEILRAELVQAVAALSAAQASTSIAKNLHSTTPDSTLQALSNVGDFWITAIAVSTGGPQALTELIPKLPTDYPTPVLIVQHMPPLFTASLAKSLNERSRLNVVEAKDGMIVKQGFVYLAPGGRHMTITRERLKMVVRLNDESLVCNVRPSADVLFNSIARLNDHSSVLAVVMTGMGEDGKAGVAALKQGHCLCLTQNRLSSVVYGMPRAVDEAGLSDQSVALGGLAERMVDLQTACPRSR